MFRTNAHVATAAAAAPPPPPPLPVAAAAARSAPLLLAALSLFCLWPTAQGYPKYWWDASQGVMPDGNACDAHPERAYPELEVDGFWLESPHGAPFQDPEIYFTFWDAAGEPATSLCPGANYTLQGSFPVPSLALLSATEGRFLSPAPTPGCPSRVDWGASISPRAASAFNATFAVPCNASASILFRVTSASRGYPGTWTWAAATLHVDANCAVARCPPDDPRVSQTTPSPPPPKAKKRWPPPPPKKNKKKPPPPSPKAKRSPPPPV